MAKSSENPSTSTLDAISKAEEQFSKQLQICAKLRSKRRGAKVMDDSDIRAAEAYLICNSNVGQVRKIFAHVMEVVGSCVASLGFAQAVTQVTRGHKVSELTMAIIVDEVPLSAWALMISGALVVIVAIVIREWKTF